MAPTLSLAEKRRLFQNGYLVLPGFVQRKLIEGARHAINASIGQGMNVVDMPTLRVRSFCPELRKDPVMMALLIDSGLWEVGESLMGEGQVCEGSQGAAQINLRFPVPQGPRTQIEPHLDGMASRSNSVPTGELHSFTALIGIMLSDMPHIDSGNFTVWPGSHLSNAAYLRDQGPKTLLNGMPSITLPEPIQITGRAGDAVLTHYLLSHGTAPNWSCDIRYMVFFRLSRVDHQREKWASLVDPWLQWPALRGLASSNLSILKVNPTLQQVEAMHKTAQNDLSAGRTSSKYFRRHHQNVLTCGIKVTHDAAIALLKGNRLIFSVEIEKLNSNPRHSGIGDAQRIFDALASFGYSPDEVDRFVVDGWGIKTNPLLHSTAKPPTCRDSISPSETALVRLTDQGVPYELQVMRYRERTLLDNIAVLGNYNGLSIGGKKFNYRSSYHVTGHILSAYLTSPYSKREEDSYVLTWDGGIYPSLYLVRAQDRKIDCLGPLFRLFGSSYEIFARSFPPFQPVDEHTLSIAGKVMAYIALGKVQPILLKALKIAGKELNNYRQDFPLILAEHLKQSASCCSFSTADFLCTFHWYLQGLLCATLEQFSKKLNRKPNLCISGGCALNIKWNSAIRELGLFSDVYIPPFPNDSGSAIGAACADLFSRGEVPTLEWSVYSGPRLHAVTPASGWEQREFSLSQLAALLHETQEPVVFLNGRAELGPRALGNRSILASASSPKMKDLLNSIKNREPYRPVAPICLEAWASRIFDPGFRDPYMLFEHRIRTEWRDRIPAVLHLDQTARLQTVSPQDNPIIAELLASYLRISGVPVLCNTSANYPGAGFFPSVRAATEWDRVNYVWSDNLLYERISKRLLST